MPEQQREQITSMTLTVNWAEQGGLCLMVGDRFVTAVINEDQLAMFVGGFLKAMRGQARTITLDIEDHNKLLEYRDKYRRLERAGSATQGIAQRLKPELSVEPQTEEIDDTTADNVHLLGRLRNAFGGGSKP